ncbi:MAG: nucleotide-diphospho-sugar transferase [Candidatus Aenigmatarchaeota archaeon]
MKQKFKLKTPVLFLVFNRLKTTKKVFNEIKKVKPKKFYIAADGPRNEKEKYKTESVREYILTHINWPCKVKTLFREKNLGCRYAVSSAITWFFQNERMGIILEDDCLPSQSFFRFCQELLEKYKNEKKVALISGYNPIEELTKRMKESYWFSKNSFIWGWATWRKAWRKYKFVITKEDIAKIVNLKINFLEKILLKKRLKDVLNNKVNTWDYQWDFTLKENELLCIVPKVNLIENIGFFESTFTNIRPNKIDKFFLYKKRSNILFPLIHPKKIIAYEKFDNLISLKDFERVILKKLTSFFL